MTYSALGAISQAFSCRAYSHLLQNPCQFDAPAIDSRFHGSFGHGQHLLNLSILQLLQVAQDDRFTQLRRKPCERRLYLAAQFPKKRLLIGPAPHGFLVFHQRHFVVQRIGDAVPLGSTVMVNQEIARHTGHPCSEPAMGGSVRAQSPVDPEEDVLRQVLGFGAIACEPVADVKDAARMATHKFLPGRPVALEALLDQLGVLLQRIISLCTYSGARRVCEPASLSKAVWQSNSACQLWNVNC